MSIPRNLIQHGAKQCYKKLFRAFTMHTFIYIFAYVLHSLLSLCQGILYSMVQSNATTIGNDNNIQIDFLS